LAILCEYESKYENFTVIDSLNGGTASARNIGLEVAQGDYIWFIDSDDWIEKDSLKLLNDNLIDKNLDILCFNGKLKYEEDGRIEQDSGFEENLLSGWEYYNKYALIKCKFHFVCVVLRVYRRDFLFENNLFFENSILHEDNLFTPLACYYAQTVKVIPDCLYVYRIRAGSIMQTVNVKKLYDRIMVANKLSDFFIPAKNIDKHQLYREIAGQYFGAFMSEELKLYGNIDGELKKLINWKSIKEVSIYPRHRRIYFLLYFQPNLFRIYIWIERKLGNK
jgi:glycosyltransferase involved in cell wall biosynthesis